MILHLKLFGRYFPKKGPALVRMPKFEFHQKQSSIYLNYLIPKHLLQVSIIFRILEGLLGA